MGVWDEFSGGKMPPVKWKICIFYCYCDITVYSIQPSTHSGSVELYAICPALAPGSILGSRGDWNILTSSGEKIVSKISPNTFRIFAIGYPFVSGSSTCTKCSMKPPYVDGESWKVLAIYVWLRPGV